MNKKKKMENYLQTAGFNDKLKSDLISLKNRVQNIIKQKEVEKKMKKEVEQSFKFLINNYEINDKLKEMELDKLYELYKLLDELINNLNNEKINLKDLKEKMKTYFQTAGFNDELKSDLIKLKDRVQNIIQQKKEELERQRKEEEEEEEEKKLLNNLSKALDVVNKTKIKDAKKREEAKKLAEEKDRKRKEKEEEEEKAKKLAEEAKEKAEKLAKEKEEKEKAEAEKKEKEAKEKAKKLAEEAKEKAEKLAKEKEEKEKAEAEKKEKEAKEKAKKLAEEAKEKTEKLAKEKEEKEKAEKKTSALTPSYVPVELSQVANETLIEFNDLKNNKLSIKLINFLISQNIITQPLLTGTIFFGKRNKENEFLEILFGYANYKNISSNNNSFYFVKSI